MHRNKMLVVLFALVVLSLSQLACGGTGDPGVAPDTNVSDVEPTSDSPVPTDNPIPEELRDVATMQSNGVIIHKTLSYVMDTNALPQSTLDTRKACFTALSLEETSDSCTANLTAEFSRMPAPCTLSPKAEAPKTGICSYVAK